MKNMIFFILNAVMLIFIITLILLFISIVVSKKSKELREKMSPFECGFDFFSYSRLPFSLKFFLIAIIFIIFDVEIALIMPLISSIYKSYLMKWITTCLTFMFILFMGVIMEWKEKSLDWKF